MLLPFAIIFLSYSISSKIILRKLNDPSPLWPALITTMAYIFFHVCGIFWAEILVRTSGIRPSSYSDLQLIILLSSAPNAASTFLMVFLASHAIGVARTPIDIRNTAKTSQINWTLWSLAIVLGLSALALLNVAGLASLGVPVSEYDQQLALGIVFVWIISRVVVSNARRIDSRRRNLLAYHHLRPQSVLFLRSFIQSNRNLDSSKKIRQSFFSRAFSFTLPPSTIDEYIDHSLEDHVEFVSVGSPDDFLPELGSRKLYLSDLDWQEHVARLMQEAGVILVLAGHSDSLKWELDHIKSSIHPSKVLFSTPVIGRFEEKLKPGKRFYTETWLEEVEHLISNRGFIPPFGGLRYDSVYSISSDYKLAPEVIDAATSHAYVAPINRAVKRKRLEKLPSQQAE